MYSDINTLRPAFYNDKPLEIYCTTNLARHTSHVSVGKNIWMLLVSKNMQWTWTLCEKNQWQVDKNAQKECMNDICSVAKKITQDNAESFLILFFEDLQFLDSAGLFFRNNPLWADQRGVIWIFEDPLFESR